MEYEKDLKIDESALDVEWLEQPRLMMRYAKHAAQMKLNRDMAKEEVDYVRAELDKAVRSEPEAFGIAKPTEGAVSSAIIDHEKYKKTTKKYLQAKFEYEVAKGAVSAFEQRKSSLENLVKLHGQQYFAGPSIPRDLSKEWEEREKQKDVNKKIASKMKRTIK